MSYSVRAVLAYGLGNAMTFPMSVAPPPCCWRTGRRGRRCGAAAQAPGTIFFGVPTFYAGFLAAPACQIAPRRNFADASPPEKLTGRCLQCAGARFTAAIFSTASARPRCFTLLSNAPGATKTHHRNAGPVLHAEADSTEHGQTVKPGEMERTADQRSHRRGHVLVIPRAFAHHVWRVDALRHKIMQDAEAILYCGRNDDI